MSTRDIDKAYVSPIDKFLYQFDRDHENTLSQLKEIKKNGRIAMLRDDPNLLDSQDEIWKEF